MRPAALLLCLGIALCAKALAATDPAWPGPDNWGDLPDAEYQVLPTAAPHTVCAATKRDMRLLQAVSSLVGMRPQRALRMRTPGLLCDNMGCALRRGCCAATSCV